MGKIVIILRKPPYGDINAAEAVRHALGAASEDFSVLLVLVDGGVEIARKGHDEGGTGFTNLAETLKDCGDMGVGIFADELSLIEHGLKKEELVDGVETAGEPEISGMISKADTTMIF